MRLYSISIIIVTMILVIATVFSFSSARSRVLDDADRDLGTRAQLIANSIDLLLQNRMVEAFTFAALPSLRGFVTSDAETRPSRIAVAQSELQSIVAADPLITAASIVDTQGIVILTTDASMNADWIERAFVRQAMMGHLYASAPARDFDVVSEYFSAPILNNAGNVAGVLVVRVAVEELWSLLPNVFDVLVLDENGVRIADSSMTPRIFAAIAPLSNDALARVLGEKRYGTEIVQIYVSPLPELASQLKGSNPLVSFPDASGKSMRAAIRRIGTNPWTVVAMTREDVILASINWSFWQAFGLGILVTLAIGALVRFDWRGARP